MGCPLPKLKVSPIHATKAYGGAKVQVLSFLTSALYGGEWPASQTGHFMSGKLCLVPNEYKTPELVWTF